MTTVFVVSSHLMFAYGLNSLLRQETQLEVLGQESEIDQAIKQIKMLQPDVVILDSSGPAYNKNSGILHILEVSPDSKVVNVNLYSNKLAVYEVRHRMVENLSDLFDVFENRSDQTF